MSKTKPNRMLSGDGLGRAQNQLQSLAAALIRCGSIAEFRSAAPLPKDAQELIDREVVSVGLDRLSIVRRLLELGLTFPLSNWLSVMELYWEKEAKIGDARRTMTPGARGERQMPDRSGNRIPIYATIDDFSLNIRTVLAAERAGAPLDVSMVGQASRRVNEAIEDAMINGAPLTVGGNSSPGLLNAPNVNTQTYSGSNPAWDHASKTGQEILTDVLAMASVLKGDKYYGPYELFIPTDYENKLNNLFSDGTTTQPRTIRQILEDQSFGGRSLMITTADLLPDDRTVMLQATSDVVDVVVGQEPVPVTWQDGPGWEFFTAVLACIVPRVKDDYDGNSGIVTGNVP